MVWLTSFSGLVSFREHFQGSFFTEKFSNFYFHLYHFYLVIFAWMVWLTSFSSLVGFREHFRGCLFTENFWSFTFSFREGKLSWKCVSVQWVFGFQLNTEVNFSFFLTRRVKKGFSCLYFFTSNHNAASLPSFSLIFLFSSFSSTFPQWFVSR